MTLAEGNDQTADFNKDGIVNFLDYLIFARSGLQKFNDDSINGGMG